MKKDEFYIDFEKTPLTKNERQMVLAARGMDYGNIVVRIQKNEIVVIEENKITKVEKNE